MRGVIFTREVKLKLIDKVRDINGWISRKRKQYSRFIYVLIASYLLLFAAIMLQASIEIISVLLLSTLIIPFAMVVMILTENRIYTYLKESIWGKGVISVMVAIYSAMAYIWASGEVNRIFEEAPGVFPWAVTILTISHFFKNIVLVIVGGYFLFILLYLNFWVFDALIISYKDFKDFSRRVVAGVMLVFGLGLSIGSAGFLTQNSDMLAKITAVKADFNQHHKCSNPELKGVSGVVFLSQGYVLAARQLSVDGWDFEKMKCSS